MIEPRSKSETISESTKTHLIDVFVSYKYDRRENVYSKFLDKGNEREEDSVTLLSRIKKMMLRKNDIRLENEFISGEPDIYLGENINCATETFDTKTSWSAHTFFRAKNAKLDKMYYWQGIGYMWLTGAAKHTVAYCLVNGTATAIMDEKRKQSYQNGMIDISGNPSKKYLEICKQIEVNHIFDIESFKNENPFFEFDNDINNWHWDIPMEDRIHLFEFERNNEDIVKLEQRIKDCRIWMNENLFKL